MKLLHNLTFLKPVVLQNGETACVSIQETQDHGIEWVCERNGSVQTVAKAELAEEKKTSVSPVNIPDFKEYKRIEGTEIYKKKPGVYDKELQCISYVYKKGKEAWGIFEYEQIKQSVRDETSLFAVLVDAALLCRLAFYSGRDAESRVPFFIETVKIGDPLKRLCFCRVLEKISDTQSWEGDISLFTADGEPQIILEHAVLRSGGKQQIGIRRGEYQKELPSPVLVKEAEMEDHVIKGLNILAGVLYPAAAAEQALEEENGAVITGLADLLWLNPAELKKDSTDISIHLKRQTGGLTYELSSKQGTVFGSGSIVFGAYGDVQEYFRDSEILARCTMELRKQEFYDLLRTNGYQYGARFMPVESVAYSDLEAVGALQIPAEWGKDNKSGGYVPAVLEGGLQIAGYLANRDKPQQAILPFHLESLKIYRPMEVCCRVFVKLKEDKTSAELKFYEEDGRLAAVALNYRMRAGNRKKTSGGEVGSHKNPAGTKDIAIIGMAGIMPGCEDLEEFWEALKAKRTLTGSALKGRSRGQEGLLPVTAGFLKEADRFDHRFFGISPREAELMDPQQRIALETVWKAIEDSGYSVKELSGSDTGVFIGVAGHDYRHLLDQGNVESEAQSLTGNAHNILTGRISYLLNLKGPSEPVDTACSSSLQAVQHGISVIREGKCKMALVGGINVIADESLFHSFGDLGILSKSGVCRVFDRASDGMIRGEGAGIFLLKSLRKAEEDGDHIWAVIKGSATGHGGRSYSLTAPGKDGQAAVLKAALEDAAVEPETISFVEAHGTGTPLGDPIEIDALKEAYQGMGRKKCGIGTVKSSIGHLETAAGAASILKVILCMQHEMLPGNANFEQLSPHINLSGSGFYVLKETGPWKKQQDENGCTLPLRAGISSFGLSGVNAHLILESYDRKSLQPAGEGPWIFVLSAKTKQALREYCRSLKRVIASDMVKEHDLPQIAYTLQKSRGDMKFRASFIASGIRKLEYGLNAFLDRDDACIQSSETADVEKRSIISVKNKTLEEIANLWEKGDTVADWELLYDKKPVKMSLPTYPFEKHTHWIRKREEEGCKMETAANSYIDVDEISCSFLFQQDHRFLKEHIINETKILPAVAYLELVRSACRQGHRMKEVKSFRNLVWRKGIVMREDTLRVLCHMKDGEWCNFGIGTQELTDCMSGECSGMIPDAARTDADLSIWMELCENQIEKEQFYTLLNQAGFRYGSLFQPIQCIHVRDKKAISEICIQGAAELVDGEINAAVLEGALQTAGYLVNSRNVQEKGVFLPYSIKELHLFYPLKTAAFATAELNSKNEREELDLKITDRNGKILAEINGYTVKLAGIQKDKETACYKTVWKKSDIGADENEDRSVLVLFAEEERLYQKIEKKEGVQTVWVKPASRFKEIGTGKFEMDLSEEKDYKRLSEALSGYMDQGLSILYFPELPEMSKNLLENVEETAERMILPLFYLNKFLRSMKDGVNFRCRCFYSYKNPAAEAVSGFVKSLNLEFDRCLYQCIGFDDRETGEAAMLREIYDHSQSSHIRYINGTRYTFSLKKAFSISDTREKLYMYGGVYWITGGAGKLGLQIAEYLSEHYSAYVIISGRSPVTSDILEKIKLSCCKKGEIQYIQTDVTRKESVEAAYEEIKRNARGIDGIIHCAGVTNDALAVNKTPKSIWDVISPKVHGTVILDEVTKNEDIRWFLLFSSVTGAAGNVGQSDYAYANCFMECYAQYRNSLSLKGLRKGRTVAVNWPYIKGGGMVPPEGNLLYGQNASIGMPLPVKDVLGLMETADLYTEDSITVFSGSENAFAGLLNAGAWKKGRSRTQRNEDVRPEKTITDLIADITHMKRDDILPDTNLEYCGFDSVVMAEFTKKLQETYQIDISPAFFFEIGEVNPNNICRYLEENYGIKM